jgi:ribulose-phosphate 3-epimerase
MIQIVPSLLATTEDKYTSDVQKLTSAYIFNDKWVHIDVMDNKFVQSQSIEPEFMKKYPLNNKVEVHLMVEDIFEWIKKFDNYPVLRFIAPVEAGKEKISKFISQMKDSNLEIGLSVNPETPLSEVEPFIDDINLLLIMTIHPGFQGQPLVPETIGKVREAYKLRLDKNLNFLIEVDGAVKEATIRQFAQDGVDLAVVGSGLFKYDNLEVGLKTLLNAAHGHNSTA